MIIAYTAVIVSGYITFAKPILWIEPLSALFYFANYLEAHYIAIHSHMQMPFETLLVAVHRGALLHAFPDCFSALWCGTQDDLACDALVAVCLDVSDFETYHRRSCTRNTWARFYFHLPSRASA